MGNFFLNYFQISHFFSTKFLNLLKIHIPFNQIPQKLRIKFQDKKTVLANQEVQKPQKNCPHKVALTP